MTMSGLRVAHFHSNPAFSPSGPHSQRRPLDASTPPGQGATLLPTTHEIMNADARTAESPDPSDEKTVEALAPQRSLIAFFVDPEAQVAQETQLPLDADGSGPDLARIKERLGSPGGDLGWVTLTHEALPKVPSLHMDFSSADAASQANEPIARYSIAFCLDQAHGALCEPSLPHGTHGAFTGQAFVVFFEDMSNGDSRPLTPPMSARQFAHFCGFPTERQAPPSLIPLADPLAPKKLLADSSERLASQLDTSRAEEPSSLRATGPLDFLADFDEWVEIEESRGSAGHE